MLSASPGGDVPRFKLNLSKAERTRAVLALLIAVTVWLLLQSRVQEASRLREAWSPTGYVLVTTRDLSAGHQLEGSDISTIAAPGALTPGDAVGTDAGIGQILNRDVRERSILTEPDITDGIAGPAVGRRWVAIPIDSSARPNLASGDTVDLFGADPFGASALLVTAQARVIEVTEDRIVVEVAVIDAAAVAAAASRVVIPIRAPPP